MMVRNVGKGPQDGPEQLPRCPVGEPEARQGKGTLSAAVSPALVFAHQLRLHVLHITQRTVQDLLQIS